MHELAVTRNVLEIALGEAERHAAKRIKSIRLTVGEHSGIDPDALRFCFEVISRGTMAEGAALEFEMVRSLARCERCDTTWTPADGSFFCPTCGEGLIDVLGGQELRVDSLEVEQ